MPVSPEDLFPVFALRSIMQKNYESQIFSSAWGKTVCKTIFPEAPWYFGNNFRRLDIF